MRHFNVAGPKTISFGSDCIIVLLSVADNCHNINLTPTLTKLSITLVTITGELVKQALLNVGVNHRANQTIVKSTRFLSAMRYGHVRTNLFNKRFRGGRG